MCWRLGFEERKESSWDRVGMGGSLTVIEWQGRAMMCDLSTSHDDILHILERLRRFNLGSRHRAKKQETPTGQ